MANSYDAVLVVIQQIISGLMKLVFFLNSSWNAYKFRRNLIISFLEKGHEIIIYCPEDKYLDEFLRAGCKFRDIKFHRKGRNPLKELIVLFKLFIAIRSDKPDAVLSFTIKPNLYSGLMSRCFNFKFYPNITGVGSTLLNSGLLKEVIIFLYRFSLSHANLIFFQNNFDLEDFTKNNYFNNTIPTKVLPGSGIDISKIDFLAPQQSIKKKTFIYVGRLIKDKGIFEFLEVAKKCIYIPNLEFKVIGDFDDGNPSSLSLKEREDFMTLPNLCFMGFQENPFHEIQNSYCLVLPSYREGTSRVILESCALGTPVIASDVPGCNNIIKDGFNGFLCQANDIHSLETQILKMMNIGFETYCRMCVNARSYVESKFDERYVIKEYHAIFKV